MIPKVPVKYIPISSGDEGIYQTVGIMKSLIDGSIGNQLIRRTAESIVNSENIEPADDYGEVEAIYKFVKDRVRFTRDPQGLEYVQTPQHLLEKIHENGIANGDCDDKTVLGLSLLRNIGHKVGIKITSYRPDGKYTHVYGIVKVDGRWVPFDTTRPDRYLGWEAPGITREKTWLLGATENVGEIRWDRILENALSTIVAVLALVVLGLRGMK